MTEQYLLDAIQDIDFMLSSNCIIAAHDKVRSILTQAEHERFPGESAQPATPQVSGLTEDGRGTGKWETTPDVYRETKGPQPAEGTK